MSKVCFQQNKSLKSPNQLFVPFRVLGLLDASADGKLTSSGLDTASDHASVAGLVDEQRTGHGGERSRTDKHWHLGRSLQLRNLLPMTHQS